MKWCLFVILLVYLQYFLKQFLDWFDVDWFDVILFGNVFLLVLDIWEMFVFEVLCLVEIFDQWIGFFVDMFESKWEEVFWDVVVMMVCNEVEEVLSIVIVLCEVIGCGEWVVLILVDCMLMW